MSREEQVTQLTDYMAKFIAHVAKNFQMMSSQNFRNSERKRTACCLR